MDWASKHLEQLARSPICGYYVDSAPSTEATAWNALALAGAGRTGPVTKAAQWLAELQQDSGSVGISQEQTTPRWPTSLAVLVWLADGSQRWQRQINAATDWTLNSFARTYDFQDKLVGHDTTIPAWSWVDDTHCWVEPTSLHIVALTAAGHADHQRTRDGIRMLLNRQMIGGGCNYGNTSVLGQPLVAHVMPSGYSLVALSIAAKDDERVLRSLEYLKHQVSRRPTSVSLSMASIAISAFGVEVERRDELLETALNRSIKTRDSMYRRALAVLASQSERNKLIGLMRKGVS